MLRALAVVGLAALTPWLLGGTADPGVLLELERESFTLRAVDLAQDVPGPTLRVVLGSPAHPTPSGEFPLHVVVRNPGWSPGRFARSLGARSVRPSRRGPMGAAKIPFAERGEIAVHGGAQPLLLGKPVSLGCVRTVDAELLGLVEWLEARGALAEPRRHRDGEVHQAFRRPARVIVR
jgi:hypothetical protein